MSNTALHPILTENICRADANGWPMRAFISIGALPSAAILMVVTGDRGTFGTFARGVIVCAILYGIALVIAFILHWWSHNTYLVFLPDGVKYHSPLYSLYTDWQNVKAIGLVQQTRAGEEVEAILLHQPVKATGHKRFEQGVRALGMDAYIPLTPFRLWRYKMIGHEVYRHKPQLLGSSGYFHVDIAAP